MGLDMYLHKRTYVKNWEHMKPEQKSKVTVLRGGKPITHIKPERISSIEEEVAYWRKANQIHDWFVQHVQDGKDDCGEYFVTREQLKMLLAICEEVLENSKLVPGDVWNGTKFENGKKEEIYEPGRVILDSSTAERLLPTTSGFFFGSTQYDQYYLRDVEYTADTIRRLLQEANDPNSSLYYHSSW